MQDMAFNQSMLYGSNQSQSGREAQQGGQWYFYNLNAKSFGQPEFRMTGGKAFPLPEIFDLLQRKVIT